MTYKLEPPLVPRDGRTLRVLDVARISTPNQKDASLRDQGDLCEQWLADHYDGKSRIEKVATRGSGEELDREELKEIRRMVATEEYDLVFMEDLGRYLRDIQAMHFCGYC